MTLVIVLAIIVAISIPIGIIAYYADEAAYSQNDNNPIYQNLIDMQIQQSVTRYKNR